MGSVAMETLQTLLTALLFNRFVLAYQLADWWHISPHIVLECAFWVRQKKGGVEKQRKRDTERERHSEIWTEKEKERERSGGIEDQNKQ